MTLRVTIDLFSGRPNPVFTLTAAESRKAIPMLMPGRLTRGAEPPPLPSSLLGYRGMIVEQVGRPSRVLPRRFRVAAGFILGQKAVARAADEAFEDFVCGSTGLRKLRLGPKFDLVLRGELDRLRRDWLGRPGLVWPPDWLKLPCPCAPLYEPDWWNDAGMIQYGNNCYNYATNYRTDTFAQPGRASGAMYTALTCASVKVGAVADRLIDAPKADNKCPAKGHLVALVTWPGWDFHWYRKGRTGRWSHKPGGTPVTMHDGAGALITDPRTADRGPYTTFCTFMVVMHGHIKLA